VRLVARRKTTRFSGRAQRRQDRNRGGLAWRIAQNKDAALAGKRIVQLNGPTLLLEHLHAEIRGADAGLLLEVAATPDIILFIDEIHTLVGLERVVPTLRRNIMKPRTRAAASCVIGATTMAEYRKYMERDRHWTAAFNPSPLANRPADEAVQIITTAT